MALDVNMLVPQVSRLGQEKAHRKNVKNGEQSQEFKQFLAQQAQQITQDHGVQLSLHAAKRMQERNMDLQGDEFLKIKDAIGKLKSKGGQDSLVITDRGAFIVDVHKGKIVTAIDKESLNENVFTKIDSTIII